MTSEEKQQLDTISLGLSCKYEEPNHLQLESLNLDKPESYPINKVINYIGRSKCNDIVLKSKGVSRVHAKLIYVGANQMILIDNDSTNGTLVNGKKITKSLVESGYILQFDKLEFYIKNKQSHDDQTIASLSPCIQ